MVDSLSEGLTGSVWTTLAHTTRGGALMHDGSGQLIRQTLMYAKPWQRYLIGVFMLVSGVVLVLIGHIAGGLLALGGAFLLWRMVRSRLRRSRSISERQIEGGY